ncbi:MAG: DUF6320 domain-containing protein [Cellulosilyticaceae bacterium]
MRQCEKCHVEVQGALKYCPLCQSEIICDEEEREDSFPILPVTKDPYHLVIRILTFVCLAVGSIAVVINMLIPIEGPWSLIVVVTAGCVWVSVMMAIFQHKNILKYLSHQSIIILLFALYIDYSTGAHWWSVTYVLPILFTLTMVVMYALSKILNLVPGDYMIYLLTCAVFGIIPIIFIGSDVLTSDIPSIICVVASIVSVIALIVFEGQKMYDELKRRLHV